MEKRIIPTCVSNNRLNSLIEEIEIYNVRKNFKIKCISKDDFFKNKLSFVIVDEHIFLDVIKQKKIFKQIILIKTSKQILQSPSKETEVITIHTPFRLSELYNIISNRIHLISSQIERAIKFNFFTYDPRVRTLFDNNFSIRFTEKESNIFEYLLENSNQYVSKKVLLKEIWSYSEGIDTHTLETHIYSLRKKIADNLTLKNLINFEEKKGYFLDKNIL